MQDQTQPLVRRAMEEKPKDPDYMYKKHEFTGRAQAAFRDRVRHRQNDGRQTRCSGIRSSSAAVAKIQGPNFIPTWDSMVFKQEGAGAAIPWHRDAGTGNGARSPASSSTSISISMAPT